MSRKKKKKRKKNEREKKRKTWGLVSRRINFGSPSPELTSCWWIENGVSCGVKSLSILMIKKGDKRQICLEKDRKKERKKVTLSIMKECQIKEIRGVSNLKKFECFFFGMNYWNNK